MTDQPYYQLPPAQRRRLVFRAVLRGVLSTTALVVVYYVLPLNQPWSGDAAVRILIGLAAFAGIAVWQVRSIAGSRYPNMKAFEALGLILPFYLLVFASTYFVMQRASAANFTQPLTRTDALYFSRDSLLHGGIRGHHPQVRGRPGGADRPDARRHRAAGRRRAGPAGGRAPRPATTGHERPGWPGGWVRAARTGAAGRWTCVHRKTPCIGAVALVAAKRLPD